MHVRSPDHTSHVASYCNHALRSRFPSCIRPRLSSLGPMIGLSSSSSWKWRHNRNHCSFGRWWLLEWGPTGPKNKATAKTTQKFQSKSRHRSPHHCSLQFSASSKVDISNQSSRCMKKSNHWDSLAWMSWLRHVMCKKDFKRCFNDHILFWFILPFLRWGGKSFHLKLDLKLCQRKFPEVPNMSDSKPALGCG